MVGLTRACLIAGAKKIGVTLWDVDDVATSQFMVRMYSKVKDGMSYEEAYRAVKAEFKADEDFSAPRYWGAFVLWE